LSLKRAPIFLKILKLIKFSPLFKPFFRINDDFCALRQLISIQHNFRSCFLAEMRGNYDENMVFAIMN